MTTSIFAKFNDFISKHDHESMDWSDGGESEIAEGYLSQFDEHDWKLLKSMWHIKSVQWQGCLVDVLCPKYGGYAQDILIEMAGSKITDIAFEAMKTISFYCGINANAEGQFFDESIVHREFKSKLRKNKEFLTSIPKVGTLVGRKYELLQSILCSKP